MSKRVFQAATYTPTATADAGTVLANATYQGLGANSATVGLSVVEIYIGGQASASSINLQQFARDGIIAAGLTALVAPNSDGPLSTLGAGAVALSFIGASTLPQRSNAITSARLTLSLNAFGGIVRWVSAPGEEWNIVGVTVNVSESSLSCFTGGSAGLVGSHIVYETW